jgi:3-oxoacyl-[acyl-carrier protein] reductase
MASGWGPGSNRGQLAGRVALITGAGAGRGRAAAQLFAEHGAAIVVADIADDGARETVERIEKDGGRATAVHADVTRSADCDAMVAATIDAYGRLDVLYNNVAMPTAARLVDTTEEMWDTTIATNLSAAFWACRAAIPRMLAGVGGVIVNRSAVPRHDGAQGCAAYDSATAGLVALTRQIAAEYGPRVRANVIAPGAGDSEQVALFLAGDASAPTTGAVIACGGPDGAHE